MSFRNRFQYSCADFYAVAVKQIFSGNLLIFKCINPTSFLISTKIVNVAYLKVQHIMPRRWYTKKSYEFLNIGINMIFASNHKYTIYIMNFLHIGINMIFASNHKYPPFCPISNFSPSLHETTIIMKTKHFTIYTFHSLKVSDINDYFYGDFFLLLISETWTVLLTLFCFCKWQHRVVVC